jgi:mono/diheme cytochrome c family protein
MKNTIGKMGNRGIGYTINAVIVLITMLFCFAFTSKPQNDGEPENGPWISPASADAVKNPFKADEKTLAEGKILYHNTCEQCHGVEGKGDGIQMITLSKKIADLSSPGIVKQTDGAIFWKITTGNRPMPSMKKDMKEEQRWKVILYVRELQKEHKK